MESSTKVKRKQDKGEENERLDLDEAWKRIPIELWRDQSGRGFGGHHGIDENDPQSLHLHSTHEA